MCGGMKFVDLGKILTNDELTLLIDLVRKSQDNQIYCLKENNPTIGDFMLTDSVFNLEKLLKKLETIRSG